MQITQNKGAVGKSRETLIWRNAQQFNSTNKPLLSIVIIAKDEEKCVPRLLDSINAQDYTGPFEVILADISTDKTPDIARQYGCTITKGGLPSRARNNGAKKAQGNILLFLDADVVLPCNFLTKNMQEFLDKGLAIAAPDSVPLSEKYADKMYYDFQNFLIKLVQSFYAHGAGYCIFCNADIFRKVRGFDETVTMWEDHEFVNRCSKQGDFRVLTSAPIYCDIRRLNKDGRANALMKNIFFAAHRIVKGEIRECPLDYDMQGVNMKTVRVGPQQKD